MSNLTIISQLLCLAVMVSGVILRWNDPITSLSVSDTAILLICGASFFQRP